MQAHGNSRPASGSEHQFSHVFEMERLCVDGEPAAHGACVGVAAVAMLALYEWFVTKDIPARAEAAITGGTDRDADAIDAEIDAAFADPAIVENARTEMRAKLAAATRRPLRLRALAASWPALRPRLETALVGPTVMARWLAACAAPFHPAHLGISLERFARDHRRARLIRRRYTILDCLDDLGLLDAAIAALFAPDGFWRQRASIASTGFR
jgi:glycerol-1-phosphate dehydrogenase [NAD(P)+]